MTVEQLEQGKKIEKAIYELTENKRLVQARMNYRDWVLQVYGNNSTELLDECLPIAKDSFMQLYLTTLDNRIFELQKQLESL